MLQLLIIVGYLAMLAVLGLWARRLHTGGHESYFLANRSVGPVALLLTMAATNFSAFTILGFSGAGYRIGYGYYPIMSFGTGLMAVTFFFIGIPAWQAARRLGAITPPELIYRQLGHRPLHLAYLAVMVIFTLPYLAIQPIGAGYALQSLLGIPYRFGSALVVLIGTSYVLLGGLHGDVLTDVFQGLVMLVALVVAFVATSLALGGFTAASASVLKEMPELFARPGGGATLPAGIWFSYLLLWLLCDPVFPQLFQRFLAARSANSLALSATLYPVVTGILFFFPVAIGVLGHLVAPGLAGQASDSILPLVVNRLLPSWLSAVVVAGTLAALMSTMDSQLLTLSSMLVRDSGLARLPPRLATMLLAGVGLAIAQRPPAPLLEIATETFTGLAVLLPVTVAAIYWPRLNGWAGFASIVTGEAMVTLYHYRLLPRFGLLPVVPTTVVVTAVLVAGSLLGRPSNRPPLARLAPGAWRWLATTALVFLLALDLWNWNRTEPLWLGVPYWLWYSVGLNGLLVLLFARMSRARLFLD